MNSEIGDNVSLAAIGELQARAAMWAAIEKLFTQGSVWMQLFIDAHQKESEGRK